MSSKIYFSNSNSKKRNLIWWLTRAITSAILLLPNNTSLKLSKKLLLKPVRRKAPELPKNMQLEHISIKDGRLAVYKIGTGPVVLLSHGWSGSASQLFPLMQKLADSGYQAIAFDQIAHGLSSGKQGNLFLFIKAKLAMLERLEQENTVAAVISHSMGGAAALSALNNRHPMLLIAPVFKLKESMFERIDQSGVASQLLVNILKDLEKQHNMEFFSNNPSLNAAEYKGKIHIVHDQNDRFTSIKDSREVSCQNAHISLKETKSLGHGRVISSDEVWQAFGQMMETEQSLSSIDQQEILKAV